MVETVTVSIIILNFNGESCLQQCLSSVLKTKYPSFEVILFDNGSTDRSLILAEARFGNDERLRIIRAEKNLGFAIGNNEGFKHARGKYIVFLNNDTVTDSEWLAALVDVMDKDLTVGVAQSMILEINGKKIQEGGTGWMVDSYLAFRQALGTNCCSEEFLDVFETSFAVGAAMITRRELINEIGLFDPKFPFFYDDILLSFKSWLAGKRVVTVSKSRVCHIGSATFTRSGWDTYNVFNHVFRGLMALALNLYISLNDLLKALFIFTFSVLIRDSGLGKNGRFNVALVTAYTSASVWTLRNLKYIWRSRVDNWTRARITPDMLSGRFVKIGIPAHLYFLPASYHEEKIKVARNSLMKQKFH